MKISEQLKMLKAGIDPWAKKEGGFVEIAGDKSQVVNLLASKPGAPRVVWVLTGETPRGNMDPAEESRVDRAFWAIISRGKGFALQQGDSLSKGVSGGRPMFDLVEELRDKVRSIMLNPEDTERIISYRGFQSFQPEEGKATDAFALEFWIGTDIGMITGNPDE